MPAVGARIAPMVRAGLLHADARRNAVFVCRDAAGTLTGAELLGTRPDSGGRTFKGLAPGSRKARGTTGRAAPRTGATPSTVPGLPSTLPTSLRSPPFFLQSRIYLKNPSPRLRNNLKIRPRIT